MLHNDEYLNITFKFSFVLCYGWLSIEPPIKSLDIW